MSKIRPEQRGHKALLRRGRSTKGLQYGFLAVAAIAAAGIGYVALSIGL
ncbi:hypothetical protein QMG61_11820 [Cryobacterium sp. PH31-AA6]|nr:hypothetical protein [Cryobacterium sp. PH31-AA6]MDJ0324447.1 hypothetical protein [Cryobacterium sp. PH31-AA6]